MSSAPAGTGSVESLFLRDTRHGGPPAQRSRVAARLAAFLDEARTSVDLAVYDLRLDDPATVQTVVGALTGAVARGVTVRVAYDAGKPPGATAGTFAQLQADPAPSGTAGWVRRHLDGTGVQTKAITAGGQLMHHKYVVRDAAPAAAGTPAVWTGSANLTDDAWTRQENAISIVTSSALAAAYRTDFDQLWDSGAIRGTGAGGTGSAPAGAVGWDFSPGDRSRCAVARSPTLPGSPRPASS